MRAAPVVLAGLLLSIAPVLAPICPPAFAQITLNGGALDSLGPSKPHPARRPARASSHKTPAHATEPAPAIAAKPTPPTDPAATATPAKPVVPATPPAILALPPPVAVPLAPGPPPPVVPVADDAPGAASAINNGIRVTFGPDRAELNPATVDALKQFARSVAGQTTTSVNIFAYAAGSPDDPSTPRRLSLERALAARAVLLQAGIASPRIYPRALGPAGGAEPDRVDVVTGSSTPPPAAQAGRDAG